MANILEQYKAALEAERLNENKDFPTGSNLGENDRKAYESALEKLRKGEFNEAELEEAKKNLQVNASIFGNSDDEESYKEQYQAQINHTLTKFSEEELIKGGNLKGEPVSGIRVFRAYCPECGEELVSEVPPMLNAFTHEKICLHKCKCGKKYNLEYAYPRLVIVGQDNKEIKAWGM